MVKEYSCISRIVLVSKLFSNSEHIAYIQQYEEGMHTTI